MSDNQNIPVAGVLSDLNQSFHEREVAEKAQEKGLGYVDLKKIVINPDLLALVSQEEAKNGKIIPFFRIGKKIRLALVEPENPVAKEVIARLQKDEFETHLSLCSPESFVFAEKNFTSVLHFEKKVLVADDGGKTGNVGEELSVIGGLATKIKHLNADEALNILHSEILKLGASDLHFEPKKDTCRVRARVDGILLDFFELDAETAVGLVRQIKHLAHLKLNVENVPQDGKYSFQTQTRTVDVRVSILPAKNGESVVMRFLDPKKGRLTLEALGFSPSSLTILRRALAATNGLILVTGPTGSGKTTTLHSALAEINNPEKKIITIEDPVEFQVEGIVQCEVHDQDGGLTFVDGLRAVLRQDPDVVMVGEIRDRETAETAVQAALTGHLVLSTLHTNSAAAAIPRLLNMGIAPFVFAPAIDCIVAQRLVRKVCKNCVQLLAPNEEENAEIVATVSALQARGEKIALPEKIPHKKGCPECSGLGYRGESVVAEVLFATEEIKKLIYQNPTDTEILALAKKEGMRTMREEGILKVLAGETTLEEVLRAIGQ